MFYIRRTIYNASPNYMLLMEFNFSEIATHNVLGNSGLHGVILYKKKFYKKMSLKNPKP